MIINYFQSEFFELYQQVPIVEDIKTNTILDSNGNCAVRCKIYSTVKNHLKVKQYISFFKENILILSIVFCFFI